MRNDVHFWIATFCRGVFALLFGSAIIVVPDAARMLFLMPFAVAVSILLLAMYGLVDSAFVSATAFMSASRRARLSLLYQGALGAIVGTSLLTVSFEHVQLHWFLYVVALQALFAGIGEWMIARDSPFRGTADWNYAAALIAISATALYMGVALFFSAQLTPSELAWMIFAYLIAFGMAQCLTAARMLYADHTVMLIHREAGDCEEATHHVAISASRSF